VSVDECRRRAGRRSLTSEGIVVPPLTRAVALYVAAGAAYILLGVFVVEVLFSWFEGAAFLLLSVWILPTIARHMR
jgi:hypothetical protein